MQLLWFFIIFSVPTSENRRPLARRCLLTMYTITEGYTVNHLPNKWKMPFPSQTDFVQNVYFHSTNQKILVHCHFTSANVLDTFI